MAAIYAVDIDDVPLYAEYFEIVYVPSIVFFFNGVHMKVDFGMPDNTKFVGTFRDRQDLIDLIEILYRGGLKKKTIVQSPIPRERLQSYTLTYGED